MSDVSILQSCKAKLGIMESETVFDAELIDHINGIFATLFDLGVGPLEGYIIEGETETWDDYIQDDLRLSDVPTYMGLRL